MQTYRRHGQKYQKHNLNDDIALHRKKRPCPTKSSSQEHRTSPYQHVEKSGTQCNPPGALRLSNEVQVGLMDLPTEVRLMILRYIMPATIETSVGGFYCRLLEPWDITGLFTANKQLSAEARDLLCGESPFAVKICRKGIQVSIPSPPSAYTLDPAFLATMSRIKNFTVTIRMNPVRYSASEDCDADEATSAIIHNIEAFVRSIRGT
jgi:hypothetical protein